MFMKRHNRCVFLLAGIAAAGTVLAVAPIKKGPIIGGSPAAAAQPRGARPTARPAQKPMHRSSARSAQPRAAVRPGARRAQPQKPAARARRTVPPPTGSPGNGPRVPYRSAIAVDADSGRVLFADHERTTAYPASVTKLMTFLLVMEDVRAGLYGLADSAAASAYAASMEPSKVGILPGQMMTVEDLLYSLMIKSANDAAVVLAEHSAWARSGGKGPLPRESRGRTWLDAFVARMNRRAHELGMDSTRYASPNGLPPGAKEKRGFDVSTAADIAKLCRHVVRMPGALRFTSCAARTVTDGAKRPFRLGTHNYFLPGSHDKDGYARPVPGCDGLKTGYTAASGSSIALTASRNGRRVVVVVLGSAGRQTRETAAGNILRDALGAVSVW
ncbi:MAG: hypothetical protein IKL96_01465 [Kiritimatiellae bacterium]|nr:hypothetical protein [Kiritimatiellia bacterium]